MLVGADGVRSSVRTWVDPDAPGARYVGLANFGGITREVRRPGRERSPRRGGSSSAADAFFGFIPTPDGDVVWFVNEPRAGDHRPGAASEHDRLRAGRAHLVGATSHR